VFELAAAGLVSGERYRGNVIGLRFNLFRVARIHRGVQLLQHDGAFYCISVHIRWFHSADHRVAPLLSMEWLYMGDHLQLVKNYYECPGQ